MNADHSAGARKDCPPRPKKEPEAPDDPLDPSTRIMAQLAPPIVSPTAEATVCTPGTRASMEDLLPALVRKVAWSGDGRRGTVRLEFGSGPMAGAEVVIEAADGRVRVQMRGPAGLDLEEWRRRVGARLASRGLDVEDVEIR